MYLISRELAIVSKQKHEISDEMVVYPIRQG